MGLPVVVVGSRSQLSSRNEITGWPGWPALYFTILSLTVLPHTQTSQTLGQQPALVLQSAATERNTGETASTCKFVSVPRIWNE